MEESLLAYLLADVGVAAVVGARVSWSWRKQGSPVPAITMTKTDGPRQAALGGYTGFVDAYVQADCWGALAIDALSAARALVAAFATANEMTVGSGVQGVFVEHENGPTFEGESPDRIFRTMLTLRVPYTET